MTETNLQHRDMSLTDAVNASGWPTTSEQSQGAGQGLQTLASDAEARDALASGGYSPPITSISSGWHRTATTVTSTTTVANRKARMQRRAALDRYFRQERTTAQMTS